MEFQKNAKSFNMYQIVPDKMVVSKTPQNGYVKVMQSFDSLFKYHISLQVFWTYFYATEYLAKKTLHLSLPRHVVQYFSVVISMLLINFVVKSSGGPIIFRGQFVVCILI